MAERYDTPRALRTRDTTRLRRYADNLRFYRGDQWPAPRSPFARAGGARQLTFNYARLFITKSAAYTMQDLAYAAEPVDKTTAAVQRAAEAEAQFALVADDNALDALDFDNEIDCSALGDAAYKVTWDAGEARVRVTAPDITSLYVWRRPDDAREVYRVAQRYRLDAADALDLYDIATARRQAEIVEEWTPAEFVLWVDGSPTARPNPYGFIPYVVYPNITEPKQDWGHSDIPAVTDATRELNRLLSQLSSIAELSGNPIAVLENVTQADDIGVQPGAVWELPEGAKAYILDMLSNGGVQVLLSYAELVRATLHDLAESPRSAFGDNPQGLSGVALRVSMDPLMKKVTRKRLIRTRALTARNAMCLKLLEQYAGLDPLIAAHPIRPVWGNVNPTDRSQDIVDAVALTNAALASRHRVSADLGYQDPDAELAQWLEESAAIAGTQPKQTPTPAKPGAPL